MSKVCLWQKKKKDRRPHAPVVDEEVKAHSGHKLVRILMDAMCSSCLAQAAICAAHHCTTRLSSRCHSLLSSLVAFPELLAGEYGPARPPFPAFFHMDRPSANCMMHVQVGLLRFHLHCRVWFRMDPFCLVGSVGSNRTRSAPVSSNDR